MVKLLIASTQLAELNRRKNLLPPVHYESKIVAWKIPARLEYQI
jgi:hypothetical protein